MNDITINAQVLDADGDLIGNTSALRQWTPMGRYNSDSDNLGFAGTFDGNGKTIGGLCHYGDSARYAGLFGNSAGTIRDLTIKDSYIHTTHSDGRAGAVTGLNEGTVSNCHNSGFVSGNAQIGGIVGRMNGGKIEKCSNSGAVTGNKYIGGISGYIKGAIQNCSNSGKITANNQSAGGIAGLVSDGTINYCYNLGSVKAGSRVGGIAGLIQKTSNINDCFSAGTEDGGTSIGGVVGLVLNNSSTEVEITNCYYDKTVYSGNAVGENGGSYGKATLTNVEGKTTKQFTSGEVAYLLNKGVTDGTQVWYQTLGTDAHPKFSGLTVCYDKNANPPYYNTILDVVSVNISWGDLTYTYSDEQVDGKDKGWEDNGTGWVQVENTGNTDVNVTYDYVTERTDISGSFSDGTDPVTTAAIAEKESKKIWLILTGRPKEALSNAHIGTIKLTIE